MIQKQNDYLSAISRYKINKFDLDLFVSELNGNEKYKYYPYYLSKWLFFDRAFFNKKLELYRFFFQNKIVASDLTILSISKVFDCDNISYFIFFVDFIKSIFENLMKIKSFSGIHNDVNNDVNNGVNIEFYNGVNIEFYFDDIMLKSIEYILVTCVSDGEFNQRLDLINSILEKMVEVWEYKTEKKDIKSFINDFISMINYSISYDSYHSCLMNLKKDSPYRGPRPMSADDIGI